VKVESPVAIQPSALAIHNAVLRAVLAAHRNRFAEKVNIPVALSGISPVSNKNRIAVIRIVDGCLDIVEIGWAVIIDSDYFGLAGNSQKQAYKRED